EIELIERGKLAFSLPIKIRKDSHIINLIPYMATPSTQQFMPAPPSRPSGSAVCSPVLPRNSPSKPYCDDLHPSWRTTSSGI
ncbi:hypothetical protein FRC11_009863, partial [Ceratobasidium sp. 423]